MSTININININRKRRSQQHPHLPVYPLRDAKVELHPVAALLLTELMLKHLLHRCKVLRVPTAELLPGRRGPLGACARVRALNSHLH